MCYAIWRGIPLLCVIYLLYITVAQYFITINSLDACTEIVIHIYALRKKRTVHSYLMSHDSPQTALLLFTMFGNKGKGIPMTYVSTLEQFPFHTWKRELISFTYILCTHA